MTRIHWSALLTIVIALIGAVAVEPAHAQVESAGQTESRYGQIQQLTKSGKYGEAVKLGEQVFQESSASEWPDSVDAIFALIDYAFALGELGLHLRALPLNQRIAQLNEKVFGPEHPVTLSSLVKLALNYVNLGQYDNALLLNQRLLQMAEKLLGPEHPGTLYSLNNLAFNYIKLGQYKMALPLAQRALQLSEKIYGPEHPDTLKVLSNLALNYNNMGQYETALLLTQRALQLRERVLGREHLETLGSLVNLAANFEYLGQYEKSLQIGQSALDLSEKFLGPNHPIALTSRNILADSYVNLGQYEISMQLSKSALELCEKILGPDHPISLSSRSILASSYNKLGQYTKALPLMLRDVELVERVFGREDRFNLVSWLNLAANYMDMGQYEKALPLNQQALEVSERVYGLNHPWTLSHMSQLAYNYSAMGQYDKALVLNQQTLQLRERILGSEHRDVLISLNNLAANFIALRESDKALPLSQRALTYGQLALGFMHPDVGLLWSNLGAALHRQTDTEAAIAALKASVNIYQSSREKVSRLDREALRAYTSKVQVTYQLLARWLADSGRLAEAQQVLDMLEESEQFDFIRRSGDADTRRTRIGLTPTEQRWLDRYQQIGGNLAALGAEKRELDKQAKAGLSDAQKARLKKLEGDIKVAQAAFDRFLTEMREGFAVRGTARQVEVAETSVQANTELQSLVRSLGDDVALLRYFVTDDQVGMLLTTPGIQIARSVKMDAKELNSQVAAVRRALRDPKSKPEALLQSLYQTLLAPVEKDLEQAGIKTVMLSPDGVLRYVPYGALHDGQRYAAERWRLPLYTSVVRDKLREPTQPNWQAAGLGVTRKLEDFDALPAVRAELGSIVKAPGNTGVLDGEVYLDDAFTAERLRNVGQRKFELMHVASHFRFSPGTEVNSFLLLGDGQHLTLGDIRTQNYRFDNVDLLTLSACDTGLGGGRDEKGVEIQGFGVIAQQQGAKAVLATLWQVADKSTASLMADMYRRRQTHGLSKIEALRQAQLALMNQPGNGHPFYWAPFIILGNWK